MSEKTNIKDMLLDPEKIDLDGKFLCAETTRDGYTETIEGHNWYQVTKEGADYKVIPMHTEGTKEGLVAGEDPIIVTDEGYVYFIVGTNRDSYSFPILNKEPINEKTTVEVQVLQAFMAFAYDEFRFGGYNIFLMDELAISSEGVVEEKPEDKPELPEDGGEGEVETP